MSHDYWKKWDTPILKHMLTQQAVLSCGDWAQWCILRSDLPWEVVFCRKNWTSPYDINLNSQQTGLNLIIRMDFEPDPDQKIFLNILPDHNMKGQPAASMYVREKGCLTFSSNRETPM